MIVWGCSSTEKQDKHSSLKSAPVNTIKLALNKKLIIFHDSYVENGQHQTFANLENLQIFLQHYEYLVPFNLSNDGSSINLSSKDNFSLPKFSDDQYGKDKEAMPMVIASYSGDCDEAEEVFSVINSLDQNRISVSQYKWNFMGQGECSGNTKTTCTLELVSSKEINLKDKSGSNIKEKFNIEFKAGDKACEKLHSRFTEI
jgi:hypothetical protein